MRFGGRKLIGPAFAALFLAGFFCILVGYHYALAHGSDVTTIVTNYYLSDVLSTVGAGLIAAAVLMPVLALVMKE